MSIPFELVNLAPGETKLVEFTLSDTELGFYNNEGKWKVENGDFEVYVGGSSSTTNASNFLLK